MTASWHVVAKLLAVDSRMSKGDYRNKVLQTCLAKTKQPVYSFRENLQLMFANGEQPHLYNISRFVWVLFEQEHGGSICVDVKLLHDFGGLSQAHVHIAKPYIVFIGKRGELRTREYNNLCQEHRF